MQIDFLKCQPIILQYEGGFSNHPRDPGGVTLEGIIQRVYDGYRDRNGKPRRPLTPALRGKPDWITERDAIYRAQYWNAVRGDELPAGIDLFMFDSAVNSGPFQAAKWLQRALRFNDADGHIGESTLAALRAHPDHDALIADMAARRLGMLQNLSTWNAFGDGWAKRVGNCKRIGQAWASGSVGPDPIPVHENKGDAKAYASDVAQPLIDSDIAMNSSLGSTGITGIVQVSQEKLAPFVGTSEVMTNIYMGLTIAGVAIAVGGGVYAWHAARKTKLAQRAIDGNIMAEVPEGQPA